MSEGAVTLRELLLRVGFSADTRAVVSYTRAETALTVSMEGTAVAATAAAGAVTAQAQAEARAAAATKAYAANMAAARKGAEEFVDALKTFAKYATYAAGAVAGFFSAIIVNSGVVANDALDIERQAQAMGITVEAYQELRGVFKGFGVDSSNMADLINTVSDRALMAAAAGGDAAEQFKLLGISVQDLKGKDPVQLLELLGDGFANAANDTERLAAASRLFGDDLSRKVIPLFQEGAAGIRKMRDAQADFGGVLDAKGIKKSAELGRAMARTGIQAEGLRRRLGAALAPALLSILDRLDEWLTVNRKVLLSGLDTFAEAVGAAFTAAADGAEAVGRALKHLLYYKSELAALAAVVGGIAAGLLLFESSGAIIAGLTAIGGAVAAVLGFGALEGLPLLALGLAGLVGVVLPLAAAVAGLAAAFALAALGVDDLVTYMNGGDSVIGEFIASFAGQDNALGRSALYLGAWIELLRAGLAVLAPFGNVLRLVFVNTMQTAADALGVLIEGIAWLLDIHTSEFDTWAEGILAVAHALQDVAGWLDKVIGKADSFTAIAGNLGGAAAGSFLSSSILPSLTSIAGGGGAINNNQRTATVGGATVIINANGADGAEIAGHVTGSLDAQLRGAQSLFVGD